MKNNVLTDSSNIHHCTGCSVCAVSCPCKAITIALTNDGFYEPCIDEEVCTDCGLCKESCYKFDKNVLYKNEETSVAYSAMHKNSYELKSSTSGGVSAELMRECLNQGYKILGVAYDYDKNIAVTKVASSIEEVEQFKGSKYFQSYTLDAFYEAINDSSNQKYAIFGTPCQIYALSNYIDSHKDKDKFLFIDIFCHGCPSMNLWTKYLEFNKKKSAVSRFDKIEFRNKTHGWHEFGTTFHSGKTKYESPKINDLFYSIFFDKSALSRACYDCEMRSSVAYADIRLGDFWGHQYDTNITGVSAVVLCTEKGTELFEKISHNFTIKKHAFPEIIQAQSYGKKHSLENEKRKFVLELLQSDLLITEIFKKIKKTYSLNKRIKTLTKNTIKRLPPYIYFRVKKVMHNIHD